MPDQRHPLLAAIYDPLMQPAERLVFGEQRERIGARATGRVVELATGTGAMLPYYRSGQTEEVVATDVDPHMLRRAEARREAAEVPVRLQVADAEELPFEDASFDTAVICLALCTIPEPARALSEVRRVLRPAGQLLFLEHVRSGHDVVARIQEVATPAWKRVAGGCHLARDTVATIADSGFRLEHIWRSRDGDGVLAQGRALVRR